MNIVLWPLVTEFEIQKDLCDSFVQASRQSLVSVELSACQHSCSWFMPSCSAKGLVWGRINACGKSATWVEWDSWFSLLLHVWEKEPSPPQAFAEETQSHLLLGSLQQCTQLRIFPGFSSTGDIFIHRAFVISMRCLFKDLKLMPNFSFLGFKYVAQG